jgi:hypothetical protein
MEILFVQETICVGSKVDHILAQCWRQAYSIHIDSRGSTGSLAILWNPSTIILDNVFTTRWTISVEYRAIGSDKGGVVTNV